MQSMKRERQLGRLSGLDMFGRGFPPVAGIRREKQVGMFFWLWIGQPPSDGIYDAGKILEHENGIHTLL